MALVGHQIRRVARGPGDALACLVNVDGLGLDPRDRVHGHEELRLAQPQEAPGRNLEEPDLAFPIIHQQVLNAAHLLPVPVEDFAAADVF